MFKGISTKENMPSFLRFTILNITLPVNKLADWPPNYYKSAGMFPKF